MTYNVSSGTLNSTIPYHIGYNFYRTSVMLMCDIAIAIVCVCLSITFQYSVKTPLDIVIMSSPHGESFTSHFSFVSIFAKF